MDFRSYGDDDWKQFLANPKTSPSIVHQFADTAKALADDSQLHPGKNADRAQKLGSCLLLAFKSPRTLQHTYADNQALLVKWNAIQCGIDKFIADEKFVLAKALFDKHLAQTIYSACTSMMHLVAYHNHWTTESQDAFLDFKELRDDAARDHLSFDKEKLAELEAQALALYPEILKDPTPFGKAKRSSTKSTLAKVFTLIRKHTM